MGSTLREVIDRHRMGTATGPRVQVVLAGTANALIPARAARHAVDLRGDCATRDPGSARPDSSCSTTPPSPAAIAAGVARFLAVESCGQCEPCKSDGLLIADQLNRSLRDASDVDRRRRPPPPDRHRHNRSTLQPRPATGFGRCEPTQALSAVPELPFHASLRPGARAGGDRSDRRSRRRAGDPRLPPAGQAARLVLRGQRLGRRACRSSRQHAGAHRCRSRSRQWPEWSASVATEPPSRARRRRAQRHRRDDRARHRRRRAGSRRSHG